MNREAISLNGLEDAMRAFTKISFGLILAPILALGTLLIVLGLHEPRAPDLEALKAGAHVTYYVDASQVIAGVVLILIGLALLCRAIAPAALRRSSRAPDRRRATSPLG